MIGHGMMANFLTATAWAQGAPAGAAPGGGPPGNPLIGLIPFALILVLFYVLMILPQQRQRKKQQTMLAALKKGDRVVTSSGLIGAITNIHDDVVTLQIADDVKVKMLRTAVAALRTDAESGS